MISATMGVGSLVLAGFADPAKCASIWLTWWLGDVGGQMLVTPFIVLWSKTSLKEMRQSCSAWPCCWGLRSSSNVGARPFIDAGEKVRKYAYKHLAAKTEVSSSPNRSCPTAHWIATSPPSI